MNNECCWMFKDRTRKYNAFKRTVFERKTISYSNKRISIV